MNWRNYSILALLLTALFLACNKQRLEGQLFDSEKLSALKVEQAADMQIFDIEALADHIAEGAFGNSIGVDSGSLSLSNGDTYTGSYQIRMKEVSNALEAFAHDVYSDRTVLYDQTLACLEVQFSAGDSALYFTNGAHYKLLLNEDYTDANIAVYTSEYTQPYATWTAKTDFEVNADSSIHFNAAGWMKYTRPVEVEHSLFINYVSNYSNHETYLYCDSLKTLSRFDETNALNLPANLDFDLFSIAINDQEQYYWFHQSISSSKDDTIQIELSTSTKAEVLNQLINF